MAHSALPLRPVLAAAAALWLTLAASGCGLKGALTMPSQSEEIVIRPAPGASAAPEEGQPAGAPAKPAEQKITPPEDRLPPPPLPGGNPGTVRGG